MPEYFDNDTLDGKTFLCFTVLTVSGIQLQAPVSNGSLQGRQSDVRVPEYCNNDTLDGKTLLCFTALTVSGIQLHAPVSNGSPQGRPAHRLVCVAATPLPRETAGTCPPEPKVYKYPQSKAWRTGEISTFDSSCGTVHLITRPGSLEHPSSTAPHTVKYSPCNPDRGLDLFFVALQSKRKEQQTTGDRSDDTTNA